MFKKLLFLYGLLYFLSLADQSVFALDKSYCKCRSKVSSRIVGGRISKPNAFPWQISLGLLPDTPWEIKPEKFKVGKRENLPNYFKTATHICAGAILSEYLVLTAAHCVTDDFLTPKSPTHFGVGAGNKHNLIDIYNHGRIQVEQIFVHPHYNVSLTDTVHDVAIVKLAKPLSFESDSVRPACILQENEGGRMKDYGEVISTGWGSENVMKFNYITRTWEGYKASLQLKEATFQDVSQNSSTCLKNNKLICISPIVANESVCKGDSGGPLHFILQGYTFVTGVTSFGSTKRIGPFSIQACSGEAGYSRLQSSLDWLKSIAGDEICLYEQVKTDRASSIRMFEKARA